LIYFYFYFLPFIANQMRFRTLGRFFSTSGASPIKVPLNDVHVGLGGKMVEFGGFMMPLKYEKYGELVEYNAVRKRVGVFDVSHMGEFSFKGRDAGRLLRSLVTNNVAKISIGMAQYSPMCHNHGGTVDDLLIYRESENQYMMVVNASNIEKDWKHINDHLNTENFQHFDNLDCRIENVSDRLGLLAIQGPDTFKVLEKITGVDYSTLEYYRFVKGSGTGSSGGGREFGGGGGREYGGGGAGGEFGGMIVSRTGYTGEKSGVELYCPNSILPMIWSRLMELGVTPCGLAARDILRLEAGFSLYGHELMDDINPLEANLQWAVKLTDNNFVGREALLKAKDAGIKRKVVGIFMEELRAIPRQGYKIVRLDSNEEVIGSVTSGTRSPILERGLGLAMIDVAYGKVGNLVGVKIRDSIHPAKICKTPFPFSS
jgi:aminomethyltransferase